MTAQSPLRRLSVLTPLLEAAVAAELPYTERPGRIPGRPAAVLMLLAEGVPGSGGVSMLLTRRTETVEKHKGQIAFPGGMSELQDEREQGLVTTALRETQEEVGIDPSLVTLHGVMPPLYTVTGFSVTPVIGSLRISASELTLKNNEAEIAETFWVSLEELLSHGIYRQEWFELGAARYPIHVFQVGSYRIWGATGSIIRNFLDRIALFV